jgi:hypothetical protein
LLNLVYLFAWSGFTGKGSLQDTGFMSFVTRTCYYLPVHTRSSRLIAVAASFNCLSIPKDLL